MKPQDTSLAGGRHQLGTHDKGHITEEPGEGKLSSPVLEQRWAGRLTHRLSQIERIALGFSWVPPGQRLVHAHTDCKETFRP